MSEPADDDDADWYCPKCKPVIDKRIAEMKEKNEKAYAREQAAQDRKKKQDDEIKKKKDEFERKREEKRIEKERLENELI